MSFQTVVNQQPAPAVEGDFADAGPKHSVIAGPGGLVAGPGGVTVGKFAWVDVDGKTVHSYGVNGNAPSGFVHRDQQALITQYLAENSMIIAPGFPVTLMDEGSFWAKIFGAAATVGEAIYARNSDGAAFLGSAPSGASATGSIGATFTASAGSPDATQLVVTAVTGKISVGDTVSGTGITAGTTITGQISGTTGGAGTYQLSAANTTSAATVTSFGDVLHITAVGSGTLNIGDKVTGTGVPANSSIVSQLNGPAGGTGDYVISEIASAYAASTAITVVDGVLTTYVAKSTGNVGELMKMSTWGN